VEKANISLYNSYAGEDTPKCVFPTPYVSVPSSSPDSPPSYVHGNGIHLYRPNATVHSFISDGIVTDWDAASRAIEHAFSERMRLKNLEEYPFLSTEVSWNTKENKEKMCELAFEKWGTPAYYAVDKAVMSACVFSLYSSPCAPSCWRTRSDDPLCSQLRCRKGFRLDRRCWRRARDDYSHLRRVCLAERYALLLSFTSRRGIHPSSPRSHPKAAYRRRPSLRNPPRFPLATPTSHSHQSPLPREDERSR
jgi:hypothetical protein